MPSPASEASAPISPAEHSVLVASLAPGAAAWRYSTQSADDDRSLICAVVLLAPTRPVERQPTPPPAGDSRPHGRAPRLPPSPHINPLPPRPRPAGMAWIPGGTFWMGCPDCGMPDAEPLHLVRVDGFWMDETPVTNAQFARFVRETRYVTVAERPLDPKQFPGVPASKLVPGSAVFVPPQRVASLDNPMQWWQYVGGASWRHPEGRGSTHRRPRGTSGRARRLGGRR